MLKKMRHLALLIAESCLLTASAVLAQPYTETTIHSFSPFNGGGPLGSVIQATDGNLYGTTSYGGAVGRGAVFRISNLGGSPTYNVIYSFSGGADGGTPMVGLVQASDGNLYGTTFWGGKANAGTVFRISNLAGSPGFSVIHSFTGGADGGNPEAALIQASDGNLYGTVMNGGSMNDGAVFVIANLAGNPTFNIIHNFTDEASGWAPSAPLIQASDGSLFGTAGGGPTNNGIVFRIGNISGQPAFNLIYSFSGSPDGVGPSGPLLQASDGSLYGTTAGGGTANSGTVFKITNLGGAPSESIIYSFTGTSDGSDPEAGLIQASDGNLYGTTAQGGAGGGLAQGVVFKISDLAGTPTESPVFQFTNPIYGSRPEAPLIQALNGNLCGTSSRGGGGGVVGVGAVFAIGNLAGSPTENVIYGFPLGPDGWESSAPLLEASDHNLYGTTDFTETVEAGTVFKVGGIATRPTETVIHSFTGPDGNGPGPLMQASDGNLYGTTGLGGASNLGTIFRITSLSSTPIESVIYSFTGGADGNAPVGSLIQATDGNLYGTTAGGGAANSGTVFRISNLSGTPTLTTIYTFAGGSDGDNPNGSLVQASDGNLYGTTYAGGSSNVGTIYKISNLSGTVTESVLYSFTGGPDGGNPAAGLIQATDGNLYGTASSGGAVINGGTVYRISSLSGSPTFSVIHAFVRTDGVQPFSALIQASDDSLYGTCATGGVPAGGGYGTVFTIGNLAGVPTFQLVYVFAGGFDGGGPNGLIQASDGNLYGTTYLGGAGPGGAAGQGTVFALVKSCFNDVSATNPFRSFICTLARDGVTAGCGAGNFCPTDVVLRSQMAVFLLRGEHGSAYIPPACTGIFSDVACPGTFTDWVEELYAEGITGGCGTNPLTFCPDDAVTRASMAVLLLRAQNGSAYSPPACTGVFADVGCPGAFTDWVEALYTAGITGGCGTNPLTYCPNDPVTRAQMAVFLVAAFNLQ